MSCWSYNIPVDCTTDSEFARRQDTFYVSVTLYLAVNAPLVTRICLELISHSRAAVPRCDLKRWRTFRNFFQVVQRCCERAVKLEDEYRSRMPFSCADIVRV